MTLLWTALVGLALAQAPEPFDGDADLLQACETALEAKDVDALEACVVKAVHATPNDPWTDWYGFHLAVLRGDARAAISARNRSIARGLPEPEAGRLMRAEVPESPWVWWSRFFVGGILAIALTGLIGLRVRSIREWSLSDRNG